MWDVHARQLCLKAVATVETGMRYDVIYYADAITIGYIQWYAGRACKLLKLMVNLPEYQQVSAQLRQDIINHPSPEGDWNWWAGRFLTKAEGATLKPLMTSAAGIKIQNDLAYADIEEYRGVALRLGLDANTDTDAFIFWVVMHHQNPRGAKRILIRANTSHPTLNRLYTLAINDSSFSKYKSRYDKAKHVIESGDASGVPDGSGNVPIEPDDPGDDETDDDTGDRIGGNVKYAYVVGDAIHLRMNNGSTVICQPTGTNMYLPKVNSSANGAGPEIEPAPNNPDPAIPSGTNAAKRAAVVQWMIDRIDKFSYSQGAGRDNPDRSGVGDCSSTVARAYYDVTGIRMQPNTVTQAQGSKPDGKQIWTNYGGTPNTVPPVSIMLPGDLVYFQWKRNDSRVRHVEMYVSGDQTIGHGGPDKGPDYASFSGNCRKAARVIVRRILD